MSGMHSSEMRASAARLAALSKTHGELTATLAEVDEELDLELTRYAGQALSSGDLRYVIAAIRGLSVVQATAITNKRIAIAFGLERAERVSLIAGTWPDPRTTDHMQKSTLGKLRVALRRLAEAMPDGVDEVTLIELTT
jgi:hypothetical protein